VIRAGVHIEQPIAGIEYILPVIDVSYVLITFSAQTDDRGRYSRRRDFSVVLDATAFDIDKPIVESDTAALDLFALSFVTARSDAAEVTDLATSLFGKNPQDTALVSEAVVTVLGYVRSFLETIEATDDLDGEAGVDDDQNIQFFKLRTDLLHVLELVAVTVAFAREFTETSIVSDAATKELSKNLSDLTATADAIGKTLGKALTDSSEVADVILHAVSKNLAENSVISDVLAKLLVKLFSETTDVSSLVAKTLNKPVSDAGEVADLFARTVAFVRAFTEVIEATDDLDGEAGVDDDQNMHFFKNHTDISHAAELAILVVAYTRAFTDATQTADTAQKDVGLGIADDPTTPDETQLDVTKPLLELPQVADVLARIVAYVRAPDNNSVAADQIAKLLEREVSETIDVADLVDVTIVDLGREEADTVSAAELLTKLFDAVKTETITSVDAAAIGFSAPHSDICTILDSNIKSVGVRPSDSVVSADNGSLLNQDYFDSNDYFAEDYFGTSRTF
jgi:hypothetical protein